MFVLFLAGVFVGAILTVIIMRTKKMGVLRVDTSSEDGPYLFLELSKNIDEICGRKYVIFKVCVKNLLSQK